MLSALKLKPVLAATTSAAALAVGLVVFLPQTQPPPVRMATPPAAEVAAPVAKKAPTEQTAMAPRESAGGCRISHSAVDERRRQGPRVWAHVVPSFSPLLQVPVVHPSWPHTMAAAAAAAAAVLASQPIHTTAAAFPTIVPRPKHNGLPRVVTVVHLNKSKRENK